VKILIPIFGFGRQGGYRVLSRLASEWTNSGHNVDFLVPEGCDQPYFETFGGVRRVAPDGSVHAGSSQAPEMPGAQRFKVLRKGLRFLRDEYDVFFANQAFTPWLLLGAGIPRSKRVYYIQAYEPDFFLPEALPVHWLLAKLSYFVPAFKIVNSPLYLCYKGIRADHWVPPGIDIKTFHPGPERAHQSGFVIGCIGRDEPEKGIIYVLEAFARLHAGDPRYRLRVAFGNLPTGWEHPAVQIVKVKGDDQLAKFYRSLDVLVAPGTIQHGAVHYPVMEAMACGVPIVTTGYIPANPRNAWIVANRDPAAIAKAVFEIKQGAGVSEKVSQGLVDVTQYSWDIVAERMMVLLQERSA
jgi:glycosyltransferase involved in cell wall biosynthesis